MDIEHVLLKLYKYIDVIIVTSTCLITFINLPSLLIELYKLSFGFAMLITFTIITLPITIMWLLLLACAARGEFHGNARATLRALEGLMNEEIRKLDSFYFRAHTIPHILIQLLFIAFLLLHGSPKHLEECITLLSGVFVFPLVIPLLSRILSKTRRNNVLESEFKRIFKIRVDFVGIIDSSSVNGYAVSSPLHKVIYLTIAALKLSQSELECLLAHEAYHIRYNNTYLSSAILLTVITLIYTVISEVLRVGVLNLREGTSLAILALYLSARLLLKLIMREFEKRADLFAARLVGHDKYLEFLHSLKTEGDSLVLFSDIHPNIEERIRVVEEDLKLNRASKT